MLTRDWWLHNARGLTGLPNSIELICEYLKEAIEAEKAFENRLRVFAAEGDDVDVQLVFSEHANETRAQRERLIARLAELGAVESPDNKRLSGLMNLAPNIADTGDGPEGRLVQNLISAYCMETGQCAMYQALAVTAHAAGDTTTENLAREIQAQERAVAEKLFHFLPTRSKIAFNVLTANEVDPAVETKAGFA